MRGMNVMHADPAKYAVAPRGKAWLVFPAARQTGPANRPRRGTNNGRASDAHGDAKGRLEDHVPAVSVHGGEFRRQDRGRSCRRADHDRTEARAGTVRLFGLFFLLSFFDFCRCRRLHRQPRRYALGLARACPDLGAGAVSHGGDRGFHYVCYLPHHSWRRRGTSLLGRGALRLQVVSRREANAAHRDPVAGLGVRRDYRGSRAELAYRQLQLALRVRRAGGGRPALGGRVADLGQGGTACRGRNFGVIDFDRIGIQDPVFPAPDIAHFHRLLRGDVRRLLGAVARAHLVHALYRQRSGILPTAGGLHLDPALGIRRRHRAAHRLAFAGVARAWLHHPRCAWRAGSSTLGRWRFDHCDAALCPGRRAADRLASGWLGPVWIDLRGLPAHARRVHASVATRGRYRDLWRALHDGRHYRAHGDGQRDSARNDDARRLSDGLYHQCRDNDRVRTAGPAAALAQHRAGTAFGRPGRATEVCVGERGGWAGAYLSSTLRVVAAPAAQWPRWTAPPSLTLRSVSASGTADSEISISTQKASM